MTLYRPPRTETHRWPQTCNLCGAPLQQGRCPRCGYERKKETEVVLSGFGGPFPIQFTLIGSAEGPATGTTLTGVRVPVGATLFVHTVASNDDATLSTVTWGATTLGGVSIGATFSATANLGAFTTVSATTAAQTITASSVPQFGGTSDRIAFIVGWLSGSRVFDTNTAVVPLNSNQIQSHNNSHVPNTIAMIASFAETAAQETGTWEIGVFQKAGIALKGTLCPGWFALATLDLPLALPVTDKTVTKTLSAALPWGVDNVTMK